MFTTTLKVTLQKQLRKPFFSNIFAHAFPPCLQGLVVRSEAAVVEQTPFD